MFYLKVEDHQSIPSIIRIELRSYGVQSKTSRFTSMRPHTGVFSDLSPISYFYQAHAYQRKPFLV